MRRAARLAITIGVPLLAVALATLAYLPPDAPRQVNNAAAHEAGRRIYNFRCYFCHGYSGDARTLAASYLTPQPLAFRSADPLRHPRERMLAALRDGVPGTAMVSFAAALTSEEIGLVLDFVRGEFMDNRRENTRYHTVENGWPDHGRYRAAFPFATGAIGLDRPLSELAPGERAGRALYMSACVSCHDRGRAGNEGAPWTAASRSAD